MTDLTALYQISVNYYPPAGNWTWGNVEIGHPRNDEWGAAWKHATWAEKVRYCRWSADMICRVAVALCVEVEAKEHFSKVVGASGVVSPIRELRNDGPAYVDLMVPDERAKQWLARIETLIKKAIVDDRDTAPPPTETIEQHAGIELSPNPTPARQEPIR